MSISKELIQYVLITAIRDQQFYLLLRRSINSSCFTADELMESIIWEKLTTFHDQYNVPPDAKDLAVAVVQECTERKIPLDANWFYQFLNLCDNFSPNIEYARQLANTWILSRRVGNKLQRTIEESPAEIAAAVHHAADEVDRIQLSVPTNVDLFSDLPGSTCNRNAIPTDMAFIDVRLDGGFIPGEIEVLLGATGAGKTAMCIQIACNVAARFRNHKEDKRVVFITYECDHREIRNRIVSYMARIPIKRLNEMSSLDQLCTVRGGQPYEAALANETDVDVNEYPSEQERFNSIAWLRDYLTVLDFSGRSNPSIGCGGIEEIVHALNNLPSPPGLVIVDWVGVMIDRYLSARSSKDPKFEYTKGLQRLPDLFYRHVAGRYNLPVILVHQLRGVSTRMGPGAKLSHADAEGCSSLAVYAWNAMVLGSKDLRTGVCQFAITKTRRSKSMEPVLLQLRGEFGEFVDVSKQFVIDPRTKQVVVRDDAKRSWNTRAQKWDRTFSVFRPAQ